MKLTCSRTALATAFQIVGSVVPSRTPKEILRNIKLTLDQGKATLLGTDQEVGIRYDLPEVETDSAGELLLPTQRVNAILREVQDEQIQIEQNEEALWIRSSQSEFRLSVEDPAEFPTLPSFTDENFYVVAGKSLKQGIHRTVFSTDAESTRYALGGVLMEITGDQMVLAATDGRRLAVVKSSCRSEGAVAEEVAQPVIPAKAMVMIERSISDQEEDVKIAIRANDVLVQSGPSTIYARLVEGRFPRYQDVIPDTSEVQIDLVVGPFLSAIRQAKIVTNDESRGVDFTFNEGTLTLTSVGQDIGSSKVEIPVSYEGEALSITFDPRYVEEFLRVLESSSTVTLHLVDGNNAAVFRADENYTYVVMPLSRDDA